MRTVQGHSDGVLSVVEIMLQMPSATTGLDGTVFLSRLVNTSRRGLQKVSLSTVLNVMPMSRRVKGVIR